MKTQKGFAPIILILTFVVLAAIGLATWQVLSRSNDNDSTKQSSQNVGINEPSADSQEEFIPIKNDFKAPYGWKTVSNNGLTASFPEFWDSASEEGQGFKVGGKVGKDGIGLGHNLDTKFSYSDRAWWEVSGSGTVRKVDLIPQRVPEVDVLGSDSTIISSAGDAKGCILKRIMFSAGGNHYYVELPWNCAGYGVSEASVKENLNDVIRSITIEQ